MTMLDHLAGAPSVWLCPQHGIVGATHDPECPETIRRYVYALALDDDVAAVTRTLTAAADLLEDTGTDDYVNPPTAEAMQSAATELRALTPPSNGSD